MCAKTGGLLQNQRPFVVDGVIMRGRLTTNNTIVCLDFGKPEATRGKDKSKEDPPL